MSSEKPTSAASSDGPWDETVDVVVVGSGAAGCAAAASARFHSKGRSSVVVLEKSPKLVGGTTKLAGGGWLWCPNNPYLKEMGVQQSPEEIEALLRSLAYPNGFEDPGDVALMRTFAHEWPGVVDTILREKIMELKPVEVREQEDADRVMELLLRKAKENPDFEAKTGINDRNRAQLAKLMPSYCAEHPFDLCPSGKVLAPDGSTTSLQLEKSCKRLGAEIRMGAHVVDVVFEGERAVGVVVQQAGPKRGDAPTTRRIRARQGVVFGSGGFSHNKELMTKWFGAKFTPFGTCSSKTNTGDLVRIAQDHGIPADGLDLAWLKQVVLPHKFPERIGVFFLNGDSFMVVDRTGNRFANDRMFYQQRGMQMFQNPERRCVFFVYDDRLATFADGPIKGLGGPVPWQDEGMWEDCEVRAGSVGELARGVQAKLDEVAPGFALDKNFEASLEAQLARFNKFASTDGVDREFGRGKDTAQFCWSIPRAQDNKFPNKTMHPIDTKHLRCVILGLSTLDTKGGPRINGKGQILDRVQRPIPGLYGAGNCVRSSTQYSYPASGVTIANAVLFGWLAGKDASSGAATSKL